MPSQKQLHWSELRVGITVVVAAITLATLIFLMTSAQGLFTRKISLKAYFDNTEGLRTGAPVRLQGVDVGNVTRIRIIPNRSPLPVEVTLKVSSRYEDAIHKDSIASLATAGVLGETFVDIDSLHATGPKAQDDDELKSENAPGISDVVRARGDKQFAPSAHIRRAGPVLRFLASHGGAQVRRCGDVDHAGLGTECGILPILAT